MTEATAPQPEAQTEAASGSDPDMDNFAAMADEMFGGDRDTGVANDPFQGDTGDISSEDPGQSPAGVGEGEGGDGGVAPAPSEPLTEKEPEVPANAVPAQPKKEEAPKPDPAAQPSSQEPKKPQGEEALAEASRNAEVERLKRELAALQKQSEEPKTTQPKSSEEQPKGPIAPEYKAQLPEQVLQALDSEDPAVRGNAMNGLMNGIMRTAHQVALNEVQKMRETILGEIKNEQAQTTQLTEQQQEVSKLQEKYYAAFPSHKDDKMLPIVQMQSSRLAAEFPDAPFDENFIAALGSRVNKYLSDLGVQTPAATEGNPAKVPNKPAAQLPAGTRSSQPGATDPFQSEQQSVLGF